MELTFTYPPYFLVFCLLGGISYALFLYLGQQSLKDAGPWIRWTLGFLRAFLIAGLIFLLLGPLIKQENSASRKPFLLIAQDVSASVGNIMSDKEQADFKSALNRFSSELEESYEIRRVAIGEDIQDVIPDTFHAPLSALSKVFPYWNDLYSYQPVGAAVLVTDGIYNTGSSPEYMPYELNAPLYTVALGDTTKYPDLRIQRVLYNDVAYLGDEFLIEAELLAEELTTFKSRLKLERKIRDRWVLTEEKLLDFRNQSFLRESFRVRAKEAGVNEFRLVLDPVENERNRGNNTFHFYLDVIDGRQKIHILASAPHPDISAIRQWLDNDKRFEISLSYAKDGLKFPEDADLLILHQLPDKKYSILNLVADLDQKKIPRLLIAGRKTAVPALNRSQGLVTITNTGGENFNDAQASIDKDFRLFTLEEQSKQRIAQFPPVTSFFGEYQLNPGTQTLLKQRISNIETDYPLVVMGDQNGIKTAMILGEGIWRWRLFDQLQHNSDQISREWFAKTIQYLAVIQDKSPFRVFPGKRIYSETEPILFDARFFNANYELITTPDIPLTIIDSSGVAYDFYFDKGEERYQINTGRFPPGRYRYESDFEWNGSKYREEGNFSVQGISVELNALRADHRLLFKLSESHNGTPFQWTELDKLADELKSSGRARPIVVNQAQTFPFISLKWPFFFLLILITAEWVIRRIFGGL